MRQGQEYEELVGEIVAGLCRSDVTLKLNDKILGSKSRRKRQVDLSIRHAQGLIILDAKDHRKPVDIGIIESAISFADDVRANSAAIVAANGFTLGARMRAEADRLELYTLIDPAGKHRWQRQFRADSVIMITCVKHANLNFGDSTDYFARNPHRTRFAWSFMIGIATH